MNTAILIVNQVTPVLNIATITAGLAVVLLAVGLIKE